jgi:hypothetical protein
MEDRKGSCAGQNTDSSKKWQLMVRSEQENHGESSLGLSVWYKTHY